LTIPIAATFCMAKSDVSSRTHTLMKLPSLGGIKRNLNRWITNPPWRTIRMIGDLPVLGISISTLVVVPLLGKGIFHLQNWLGSLKHVFADNPLLSQWVQRIADTLHLPHVIKLLAYSALAALVGQVIYMLRCPVYFRRGDTYADFRRQFPFAATILEEEFIEMWNESHDDRQRSIHNSLLPFYGLAIRHQDGKVWKDSLPKSLEPTTQLVLEWRKQSPFLKQNGLAKGLLKSPEMGEVIFDVLLSYQDHSREWSRRICAWSYFAALIFISLVIYYQSRWVICGLWEICTLY